MPTRTTSLSTTILIASLLFFVSGCARGLDNSLSEDGEAGAIVKMLALAPGQHVADIGAGDGEWTEVIARSVGESGRVWATEVDDDLIGNLRDLMEDEGLRHVDVVRGDQQNLGLPESCCEAALLRLVYHHFQDPAPMRKGLLRALQPGGLLLVIDIEPQKHWDELEGVPDRGGHGIPIDDLVSELSSAGFREVERRAPWDGDDERYAVLFRAPGN